MCDKVQKDKFIKQDTSKFRIMTCEKKARHWWALEGRGDGRTFGASVFVSDSYSVFVALRRPGYALQILAMYGQGRNLRMPLPSFSTSTQGEKYMLLMGLTKPTMRMGSCCCCCCMCCWCCCLLSIVRCHLSVLSCMLYMYVYVVLYELYVLYVFHVLYELYVLLLLLL